MQKIETIKADNFVEVNRGIESIFRSGQSLNEFLDEVSRAIEHALRSIDRKMPGFAGPDGIVTAPETRVSSPFRIPRDPVRRTACGIDNLYPCGEGAGYAGGIVSAAVDGIKTADAVIRRYAPTPHGSPLPRRD